MHFILQGKTLSLICGTLTWLRDHENREKCRLEEESRAATLDVCSTGNAVDWITAQSQSMQNKQLAIESQDQLASLQRREKKVLNFSKRRDRLKVQLYFITIILHTLFTYLLFYCYGIGL